MTEPNFRHTINNQKVAVAIAQDVDTNEVLMVAFINKEAFDLSIKTKKAHYYSTSRDKIWFKGEESGHVQEIKDVLLDCDEDAIIFKVKQVTAACHTGHYSCFYKRLDTENDEIIEDETLVFNPEDVY